MISLDTDVGQTEFTPPGCLSLTAIDKIIPISRRFIEPKVYASSILFTIVVTLVTIVFPPVFFPDLAIPCIKTTERCFFFGYITCKRDPTAYLECVHALYDYYQKVYYKTENRGNIRTPLVINTPGWIKGTGYDVLVNMLNYISPTHVIKICISSEKKNPPSGAFWESEADEATTTVIQVNSARQDSFNRSVLVQKDARLLRDFRIMTSFRQCFPTKLNIATIKELAHALAAHPPYEIPVSSVKIKHVHCQVLSNQIYYSLKATIVGLGLDPKILTAYLSVWGLCLREALTLPERCYISLPPFQSILWRRLISRCKGLSRSPLVYCRYRDASRLTCQKTSCL